MIVWRIPPTQKKHDGTTPDKKREYDDTIFFSSFAHIIKKFVRLCQMFFAQKTPRLGAYTISSQNEHYIVVFCLHLMLHE